MMHCLLGEPPARHPIPPLILTDLLDAGHDPASIDRLAFARFLIGRGAYPVHPQRLALSRIREDDGA